MNLDRPRRSPTVSMLATGNIPNSILLADELRARLAAEIERRRNDQGLTSAELEQWVASLAMITANEQPGVERASLDGLFAAYFALEGTVEELS